MKMKKRTSEAKHKQAILDGLKVSEQLPDIVADLSVELADRFALEHPRL